MSILVTILAVTNTYAGYCIAGLTEDGKWIRPMPSVETGRRFWNSGELTLPGKGAPVAVGDVWEISGNPPKMFQYPNHVEDFRTQSRRYVRTLRNRQLLNFLENHVEGEEAFLDTVHANGRSLCLIRVNGINGFTETWNGKVKAKMDLKGDFQICNPKTNNGYYPVTCCKWSRLLKDGYDSRPVDLYRSISYYNFIEQAGICAVKSESQSTACEGGTAGHGRSRFSTVHCQY